MYLLWKTYGDLFKNDRKSTKIWNFYHITFSLANLLGEDYFISAEWPSL